jgi:hypothetical protein
MAHLKVVNLLNSLATAKQILNDLEEYDDYDVVELLEMKYEKFYFEMPKN